MRSTLAPNRARLQPVDERPYAVNVVLQRRRRGRRTSECPEAEHRSHEVVRDLIDIDPPSQFATSEGAETDLSKSGAKLDEEARHHAGHGADIR